VTRHRVLMIGGICAGIVVLVALGLYLYTPTIRVNIYNDTAAQVTVSVCGSDPEMISPGLSAGVDPNPNDSRAACAVYRGNTSAYLGCLPIPTTYYRNGDTVNLTKMVRGVSAEKCGD
jgi:hypothetical protein